MKSEQLRLPYQRIVHILAICACLTLGCHVASEDRLFPDSRAENALSVLESMDFDTSDSPWLLMHAFLAFGPDFEIAVFGRDKSIRLLDFITDQGGIEGFGGGVPFFSVRQGRLLPARTDIQRFVGERHLGQYLFILSQWQIPEDTIIHGPMGKSTSIAEMLQNVVVEASSYSENSWVIPALLQYSSPGDEFENRFGQQVTLTHLVKGAMQYPERHEACASAHFYYALAKYIHANSVGTLRGRSPQRDAMRILDKAWRDLPLASTESPTDPRVLIHNLGHNLEWMSIDVVRTKQWRKLHTTARSLIDLILEDDSVVATAEVSHRGDLCHAAHGLLLYLSAVE